MLSSWHFLLMKIRRKGSEGRARVLVGRLRKKNWRRSYPAIQVERLAGRSRDRTTYARPWARAYVALIQCSNSRWGSAEASVTPSAKGTAEGLRWKFIHLRQLTEDRLLPNLLLFTSSIGFISQEIKQKISIITYYITH